MSPSFFLLLFCSAGLLAPAAAPAAPPLTCTYTTYRWNAAQQRPVERRRVSHPYAALTPDEIDPESGCSVCSEDQVTIAVAGLLPVQLCRRIAPEIGRTLQELAAHGVPLLSLTGYRVGMTRGPLDSRGLRTRFSNHSFGVALDLNAEVNGLYDNCGNFGPECRLLRSGRWQPDAPGGFSPNSVAVTSLRRAGLRWGGEIAGKQKDFMHFSATGY